MKDHYVPKVVSRMRNIDLEYVKSFNPLEEINKRDNYS